MMRYFVFLALSMVLVVIQTVVIPRTWGSIGLYDLIVPLAAYFSLFRPFREGLVTVLILGMVMDMISAAPIGVHLTVYLWLYVPFRHTWRLVRIKPNLLFPAVVFIGVLFENIVFWALILSQNGMAGISPDAAKLVVAQLVWAVLTSPLMLVLLNAVFRIADLIGDGALQENGQS